VIATLLTEDDQADISLNEVDAAKVKIGDKASLTFDAVEGLVVDGEITDLDLVGTESQGVVTYSATITFSSNDPRVKPGMSVSASITTESKDDVLVVPSTALKSDRRGSYVLMFNPELPDTRRPATSVVAPTSTPVEIGIVGDTTTEIVSGLSEGQQIVVRTIAAASAAASTSQAPSLFGGSGTRATGTARTTGALGGATRAR